MKILFLNITFVHLPRLPYIQTDIRKQSVDPDQTAPSQHFYAPPQKVAKVLCYIRSGISSVRPSAPQSFVSAP